MEEPRPGGPHSEVRDEIEEDEQPRGAHTVLEELGQQEAEVLLGESGQVNAGRLLRHLLAAP